MHFIARRAGDPTKTDISAAKVGPLVFEILRPKVRDIGALFSENC